MIKALLVDIQSIKDNTCIDNNVNDTIIRDALWKAQENRLQKHLGTKLYDKILDDIVNTGTVTGVYKTLVDDYIQKLLTQYTLAYAIKDNMFKVTSYGTIVISNDDYTPAERADINGLLNEVQRTARGYANLLYDYLWRNQSDYPEYTAVQDSGYYPYTSISTQDFNISASRLNKNRQSNKKSFF